MSMRLSIITTKTAWLPLLLAALGLLLNISPARAEEEKAEEPGIHGAAQVAEVAEDVDDPKLARTLNPAPPSSENAAVPSSDTKDKSQTSATCQIPIEKKIHPAPMVKLSYRQFTAPNLDGTTFPFNVIQLDLYPVSMRWFRLGFELEVGISNNQYSTTYAAGGISLGVQYPWRVTPFIDGRFIGGVVGGSYMDHLLVTYTWMAGIDVGIELYVVSRLFLSLAIGWVHDVYRGIDIDYQKLNPLNDPISKMFIGDSFTFKVGIGL